jgi:formylglycine-generating enzyme required for sulfatase activity
VNKSWAARSKERAQYWYEQAVQQLTGLDRAAVEKRISDLVGSSSSGNSKSAKPTIALELTPGVKISFQRIPAGQFLMGSPSSEAGRTDKEVQHPVKISRPFYLGTTEVTVAQWNAAGGSPLGSARSNPLPQLPANGVDRDGAKNFCQQLEKRFPGRRFRLPTEAEWEYACRAGSPTAYGFGNDSAQLADYAWYAKNSGDAPHPVGLLKPNRWGLYDTHGNVSEWVSDADGDYDLTVTVDPKGPPTGTAQRRGGAFNDNEGAVRSASRHWHPLSDGRAWVGFRIVMDAP